MARKRGTPRCGDRVRIRCKRARRSLGTHCRDFLLVSILVRDVIDAAGRWAGLEISGMLAHLRTGRIVGEVPHSVLIRA